jgi:hypothetical protein
MNEICDFKVTVRLIQHYRYAEDKVILNIVKDK